MALQVDKIVKIYRAVAQYPSPTAARLLTKGSSGDGIAVVSWWSQRNLERGKTIKFQMNHWYDMALKVASNLPPIDTSFELLSSLSQSEELRAVVREVPTDPLTKKQYLEVWKDIFLWKVFDLSALEVHSEVYTDGDFSMLEWSPCEEKLLYIAEKMVPKTEPFYKPKPQETRDSSIGDGKVTKGDEFVFRPDWGEQLAGKCQPVVCMCDIKTDMITLLDGIPPNFSPGQALWVPNGEGIVGVVWENEPRKLGLIYCTNRSSYIFYLSNTGEFKLLSGKGNAVRSPRFSPDGQYLIWLERPAGGPHHSAQRLMLYRWDIGEAEILIDIVRQNIPSIGGQPFYGLYSLALPKRCWSTDSSRILFSTPQRCTVNSYVVHVGDKTIMELDCADGSQMVLDVWDNIVVCVRSSFRQPAQLHVAQLPPPERENATIWYSITEWQVPVAITSLIVHPMLLQVDDDPKALCKSFSAIYVGPESANDHEVPLVVFPHGGPHSSFSSVFSIEVALFGLLGFGVLLVNYRGSVGAGQDSVDFLPGQVGDADVKDVKRATDEALHQFRFLNPGKVVLFGGSHGGFLVTHLSGQYPLDFKAVVARNPVIDIASMFSITDIPDWTAVETGYLYSPSCEMSCEAFEKMRKCSPINHVNNVVAPTLLLIGRKDVRVPSAQGLYYYYSLKAHNVKTKLLLYDDNHPLSLVPVEMDNLINSVLWFMQHMD